MTQTPPLAPNMSSLTPHPEYSTGRFRAAFGPMKNLVRRLSGLMAGLILSLVGLTSVSAQTPVNPLISPAELKALIEKKAVVVLDTRELFQTDGKTPNYSAGHIPGAVAAPYSAIRGPASNPGRLITEEKFSELVRSWGLSPDQHIVFAGTGGDGTDFGANARFYWTFKISGFKRLSILDGGLGAWMALKYPLETQAPVVKPSSVRLKFDQSQVVTHQTLIKTFPELSGKTDSASDKTAKPRLLDTRNEDYFSGKDKHPEAARAGTLPGAANLDHEEFFQLNTGKLLPRAQLESLAKSEGLLANEGLVTFCNSGHWSASAWFVLSEILGVKNVKMYPESVIGWSKTRLPMDNEPSRSGRLLRELKEGVRNLKN